MFHGLRPRVLHPVLETPGDYLGNSVLSPARTFWEKATLIHVECQRGEFRASAARLSRHWYDFAMLGDQIHGQAALSSPSRRR